jgi:hypothetical protein
VQPEGTPQPQPQPQPQATQPDAPLPPSAFCDQLSEVADVVKGAPLKEPMPIPKAKQRTVRQILHGLLHTGVESALLGPWVRRRPIDICNCTAALPACSVDDPAGGRPARLPAGPGEFA